MRIGDFSLIIPQGEELSSGHVRMYHKSKYSISLSNSSERRCDVEVEIDGKLVGVWRVSGKKTVILERPANDYGHFTFYKIDSLEARKAGITGHEKIGLISVLFKPENLYTKRIECQCAELEGGTGLSGKSNQRFHKVAKLDYDESKFVQLNIRLICENDEPRPLTPFLTPASNPIPPRVRD